MMLNKILVALDTEETHESLFQASLELAQQTGAKLVLLGVLSPSGDSSLPSMAYPSIVGYPFAVPESTWEAFQEQYQTYKKRGFDQLCQLKARAIAAGVTTQVIQETGDAGQAICSCATAESIDLVIVGNHGRRGFNEFLIGSVSSYVMHRAPCSVLIVREPKHVQTTAETGELTAV